jgi:hypothetical protein
LVDLSFPLNTMYSLFEASERLFRAAARWSRSTSASHHALQGRHVHSAGSAAAARPHSQHGHGLLHHGGILHHLLRHSHHLGIIHQVGQTRLSTDLKSEEEEGVDQK